MIENILLEEWQKRLGLSDWIIVLRYNCNKENMQIEDTAGETEWANVNRTAVIRILNKEAYGDRVIKFDFERILVHELLHIKFSYLQITNNTYEGKIFDEVQHQLIEDIAQALVMAKRGEVDRSNNIDCIKVKESEH